MPFDPTFPTPNTLADADLMRSQLNALNDRIDTIPAGPPGVPGAPGQGFTFRGDWEESTVYAPFDVAVWIGSAFVCLATTTGPGQPPPDADAAHWHVLAQRGGDGAPGTDGINGSDGSPGAQGPQGPQGPPFASALVDAVNTLPPGSPAGASVTFDGTNVRFTFSLPAGADGTSGADGAPGEVTNAALSAALAAAIEGTSGNTNAVPTLDAAFTNDPLSLAEGELLRAKLNELILNGRR